MGTKRTTVTHPDGTVSRRSSQTMTYTHAVAVGPAPAEAMAAHLERQADQANADAATLRKAAESGKVTIRSRGLGSTSDPLISHVANLSGAGSEVYTWCSPDGRTTSYRDEERGQVVQVGPYLRGVARDRADEREGRAAKAREDAAATRAAGVPVGQWGVVRWSSRADLAQAYATGKDCAHFVARGCPVVVVPVDATPAPTPQAGAPFRSGWATLADG